MITAHLWLERPVERSLVGAVQFDEADLERVPNSPEQ